jgi:predicted dehydrogenase
MKTLNFGLIGLGMMGREVASAVMRWGCLTDPDLDVRPRIVSICSRSLPEEDERWYRDNLGTVTQATRDYREVLANPDVDAVYVAVPHHLHEQIYIDCIRAGKHLFGEKPFGIDREANARILEAAAEHPEVFVRCVSQYYFAPAMAKMCGLIERGFFGRIIEAEAGFLHSSDLDPNKPINWKRIIEYNGEYGCMGDLGMHVLAVPVRAGWKFENVRAVLSNLVPERPDEDGKTVPCETWDNATLFCSTVDPKGFGFPVTLKMHRISPGEKNTFYLTIIGMRGAARISTKNINRIEFLEYTGKEQVWQSLDMGFETVFRTTTGRIFEFGFTDYMPQMLAAFLFEYRNGRPRTPFSGCVRPEETEISHRLFTAALESGRTGRTMAV